MYVVIICVFYINDSFFFFLLDSNVLWKYWISQNILLNRTTINHNSRIENRLHLKNSSVLQTFITIFYINMCIVTILLNFFILWKDYYHINIKRVILINKIMYSFVLLWIFLKRFVHQDWCVLPIPWDVNEVTYSRLQVFYHFN